MYTTYHQESYKNDMVIFGPLDNVSHYKERNEHRF
jgi:hypothetical protein